MGKTSYRKTLLAVATCLATGATANVSVALTASEKEQFEAYEKRIKKLERRVKLNRRAVKKVDSSLKKYSNRLRINGFLTAGYSDHDAQHQDIGGQPSLSGGVYPEPIGDISYADKTTREGSWKAQSKLGLQFSYLLDDKWKATIQLLSKLEDEYRGEVRGGSGDANGETNVEWAYFTYQHSDELTFNFGRKRLPFYLFSEYLDVGFAFPWVRPPEEFYRIPLTYFDGVSANYETEVANGWNLQVGAWYGDSQIDGNVFDLQGEDGYGASFTMAKDAWTFRVSSNKSTLNARGPNGVIGTFNAAIDAVNLVANGTNTGSEFLSGLSGGLIPSDPVIPAGATVAEIAEAVAVQTIDAQFATLVENQPVAQQVLSEDSDTAYHSLGMIYDDGKWLFIAEAAYLDFKDNLFADADTHYLSAGRRFGKFMPFVSYAHAYTHRNNNARREAYGLLFNAAKAANQAASEIEALAASVGSSEDAAPLVAGLGTIAGPDPASANGSTLDAAANNIKAQQEKQKSISLGLRWDISSRIAAKFEWNHLTDFDDEGCSCGRLIAVPNGNAGDFAGYKFKDGVNVYNVTINSVF